MCAWHIPEASWRNTNPWKKLTEEEKNDLPDRKINNKDHGRKCDWHFYGTLGWTPTLEDVPEDMAFISEKPEEDDGMKTPDPIKTSKTSPPLEKKVPYKRRREDESTDRIKTSKEDESMQKQKVKGTPGFM